MKKHTAKIFSGPFTKNIVISISVCLIILLLIWVTPIKSSNVSVQFITNGITVDQKTFKVNIRNSNAHQQEFASNVSVSENLVAFNIPKDYWPADSIYVTDKEFAKSVEGIYILSHSLNINDYMSASFEGNVWTETADGYALNESAIDTINRGMSNPWKAKFYVAVLTIIIFLAYLLYLVIKSKAGKFKAAVSVAVFLSVPFVLRDFYYDKLDKTINIAGHSISNFLPIILLIIAISVLIITAVIFDKENLLSKRVIIAIYIFVTIFSAEKMVFYSEKVANTPDEIAHISYVAYFEQTGNIIPELENAPTADIISSDTETIHASFVEDSVNNLRHPPLYYQLMRLSRAITFNKDGTFNVNLDRIRGFSMMIALSAIIIMFFIGYTRIKKVPLIHLLYAMIITSVPMFAYGSSGVNNDTLTLLTVTIFIWGILRYAENKRTFSTYLLIAIGIATTILTKLTAGIIVVVAALIVLGVTLTREKCWKDLISWRFLSTLPIYLLAVCYYLIIYAEYGSFQPAFHALNEDYAWSTGFYISAQDRIVKSTFEYFDYFFDKFFVTWAGISSHITMAKSNSSNFFETVALNSIWFLPLILLANKSFKNQLYKKEVLAVYAGVLVTLIMQYVNGYTGLMDRGYLGGFQSRYYICAILMFALAAALIIQRIYSYTENGGKFANTIRNITVCSAVFYIGLLAYEDFIYFLLNYNSYLK